MSDIVMGGGSLGDGPAWYRVELPAAWLREHGGLDVKVCYDEVRFDQHALGGLKSVMLQRSWHPSNVLVIAALRGSGIRSCYELDDDVWAVPEWNPLRKWFTSEHLLGMERLMRSADRMIVSTPELAMLAGQVNREVHVVPNALPLELVPPAKPRTKSGVRIGWAGSFTHQRDLEVALGAVRRVLARRRDVTMVFLGWWPNDWQPGPQVECHPWVHPTDLYWMLRQLELDVAIAPLMACRFNESKSFVKLLEYAAVELPVVVSPVGPYMVVDDGGTGLFAGDAGEWERRLLQLVDDERLREAMGAQARRWMATQFTMAVTGPHWRAALLAP
jgi:glycosyltransferase involved in cell wall biosynthesis